MVINLDLPKMQPRVMMFNSGQGQGGNKERAFSVHYNALVELSHTFFSYLLEQFTKTSARGEYLFLLYDRIEKESVTLDGHSCFREPWSLNITLPPAVSDMLSQPQPHQGLRRAIRAYSGHFKPENECGPIPRLKNQRAIDKGSDMLSVSKSE